MQPPPMPSPGASAAPNLPMPPQAPVARPGYTPMHYLRVRARADRRLVTGAAVGGVLFDVAVHSAVASVAVTVWIGAVAAAILFSRRVRGRASMMLIGLAPAFGLLFTFRSSPWVIVPAALAVALLLVLGVSVGADGTGLSVTFPALANRAAMVAGHIVTAPGMFRFAGEASRSGAAQKRAMAVVRGLLLGVPVALVVGLLLANADPIFRSWFDIAPLLRHLVLVAAGAWVITGLCRAASAKEPAPPLQAVPALGTIEASFVLGGLCTLYAAFVGAQFAALSGAGHRILVTHGLTYAEYARSGFFQLLACAAITLFVLLAVRACANSAHLVLGGIAGLTTVLTIGVVVVAIRRLQLYEAAYGLTMLRLAVLATAVWIGVVFALLGLSLVPRALPPRYFPAVFLISGLLLVGIWGLSNPAAIVASTNIRRAEHGQRLDIAQVTSLGADAVPAALNSLRHLGHSEAAALRHAICTVPAGKHTGTSFNLAKARSEHATATKCR